MDFGRALARITRYLDSRGERWLVVGGVALAAVGLPRTTLDLDLAVEGGAQEGLVRFMEALGYETLHRSAGFSNHLHPVLSEGRVDFIYLDHETALRMLDRACDLEGPGGIAIRVPSPEHLAAMKVQAMSNDATRTYQELADIRFLLALPGVDRAEVRTYFERQGLLERFRELEATL